MTCENCGFCSADIETLQNLATDAKARGAFKVARLYEKMLQKCDCIRNLPTENDREYVRNIQKIMNSEEWNADAKLNLAKDVQGLLAQRKLPKQRSVSILPLFPDVCTDECPYARHCSSYPRNLGQKCVKKVEANRGLNL